MLAAAPPFLAAPLCGETHARHEHVAHWSAALSGRRALRLQCQAVGPARPPERVKVLRKSDDTLMSKLAGCGVRRGPVEFPCDPVMSSLPRALSTRERQAKAPVAPDRRQRNHTRW